MQLGLIGLGRMGSGMTLRLLQGGHQVMVYDRVPEAGAALAAKGATATGSLEDLGQKLKAPRVMWLMIPAGPPVDDTIQHLSSTLSPGDVIIDGGNSNYKDSMRRAETLRSQQIEFLDVGVSGGIWGLKVGFNLMIGGDPGGLQTGRADFPDPRAPRRLRLCRPVRCRALRQDGAQRHRVFDAAELCRGGRDPQGRAVRLRSRAAREAVEPWQRDSLMAPRAGAGRLRTGPAAIPDPRLRRRLRRGTLDVAGRDRSCGAGPGAGDELVHAVPLAPGRLVQRQGDRRAAQRVRRASGQGGVTRWPRRSLPR